MVGKRYVLLLAGCFLTASAALADEVGFIDCREHPEQTQVFAKARQTHEIVATLPCGERFTILLNGFIFSRIQTKDGQVGYVFSNVISADHSGAVQKPAPAPAPAVAPAPAPAPAAAPTPATSPASNPVSSVAPVTPANSTATTQAPSAAAQPTPAPAPSAPPVSTSAPTAAPAPEPIAKAPEASAAAAQPNPPASAPVQSAKASPAPTPAPEAAAKISASSGPETPAAVAQPASTPSAPAQHEAAPAQPTPAPTATTAQPTSAPATAEPAPASSANSPETAAAVTQPNPAAAESESAPAEPAAAPVRAANARESWEKPNRGTRRAAAIELFGGYEFARLDSGGGVMTNLNGALGSFGWNVRPWLQLVADSSYNFTTISGTKNVLYGNHWGPRLFHYGRYPLGAVPFVEALFGGSRADTTVSGVGGYTTSNNCFSFKVGGGLDIHPSRHLKIRLFDFDYYRTAFGTGLHQNNYSASVGIVLRLFGGGAE